MKTLFLSLACAALAASASAFPSAAYRVSGTVGYAPRNDYVVATAPRVAVVVNAPLCYAAPVYSYVHPVRYAPRPAFYGRTEVVCERVSYGHWSRPAYPRVEARVVVRR